MLHLAVRPRETLSAATRSVVTRPSVQTRHSGRALRVVVRGNITHGTTVAAPAVVTDPLSRALVAVVVPALAGVGRLAEDVALSPKIVRLAGQETRVGGGG